MQLDDTIQQEWTERARAGLGEDRSIEVQKVWSSHHAKFARLRVTQEGEPVRRMVGKHFVPLQGYQDPDYTGFHTPQSLWPREVRNLCYIAKFVGERFGDNFSRKLVPSVYGSTRTHATIFTPFFDGPNLKKRIVASNSEERWAQFLQGVKLSARFSGATNACNDDFAKLETFDYPGDGKTLQTVSRAMLKENLARLVYNLNSDCRVSVKGYNSDIGLSGSESDQYQLEPVLAFIQNGLGINLDSRLKGIHRKEKKLYETKKYQHRDCNGLNMIGSRVLDLEDFGIAPSATDLAQNCIVVGLGNNIMLRDNEFTYALQAFLAIEHAYEIGQDPELAANLEAAGNGTYKEYVASNLQNTTYSNFLASFFYRSVERNIQLGASISRYSDATRANYGAQNMEPAGRVIEELFGSVHGLSAADFNKCSNPGGVKDLFYTTGHLLNDLGITNIPTYVLNGIQNGSNTGVNIATGRPDFTSNQ